MGTFDRASWCAAIALAAAACVPQLSESGRPCPCSGGEFKCCPTTNTCLLSEACPTESTDSDATADDGSRRDDGDAASAAEGTETSTLADVSIDNDAGPDVRSDAQDDRAPDAPVPTYGCWSTPRKSKVLVLAYNPYLVTKGQTLRFEIA